MDKKLIVESNGKENAFPNAFNQTVGEVTVCKLEGGLTKREYFAAMAMTTCSPTMRASTMAKYAVEMADALLVALDESN